MKYQDVWKIEIGDVFIENRQLQGEGRWFEAWVYEDGKGDRYEVWVDQDGDSKIVY